MHWWHNRRRNIFLAFTDQPSCNQAEVVHARWKNRDETGLSLYQAAAFDIRDSVLSEAELGKAMDTTNGKGCGPTLTEMNERRNHRNIAGVARKVQNLVDFGVAPKPNEARKRSNFNNKSTDGSEFCKKQKPDNDLKMFENRVEASYDASLIMKENKSSIINPSKEATWYQIVRHRERLLMLKSVLFNRAHVVFSQRMDTVFSVSTFCSLFFTYSMVRI